MNTSLISPPPPSPFLLPSTCSAERQAAAAGKRGRVNKLVSSYDDSEDGPELTQAVQEVCEGADAFILVADPTKMDSEGKRTAGLG